MLINESTLRSFIRQLLEENTGNNQSVTGNYSYYPEYGQSIGKTGYFAAWEGDDNDAKITEVVFVPVDITTNPYLYRFESGNESSLVIDTNPKGKKTLEEMYQGLGRSKFRLDLNTKDKGMTDLKTAIETFFTKKLGGKLNENKLTRRQRRSLRNLSHDERIVESIIRKHILKENLGTALQAMADKQSGKPTKAPPSQKSDASTQTAPKAAEKTTAQDDKKESWKWISYDMAVILADITRWWQMEAPKKFRKSTGEFYEQDDEDAAAKTWEKEFDALFLPEIEKYQAKDVKVDNEKALRIMTSIRDENADALLSLRDDISEQITDYFQNDVEIFVSTINGNYKSGSPTPNTSEYSFTFEGNLFELPTPERIKNVKGDAYGEFFLSDSSGFLNKIKALALDINRDKVTF